MSLRTLLLLLGLWGWSDFSRDFRLSSDIVFYFLFGAFGVVGSPARIGEVDEVVGVLVLWVGVMSTVAPVVRAEGLLRSSVGSTPSRGLTLWGTSTLLYDSLPSELSVLAWSIREFLQGTVAT